jgi:hypothetical protein
LKLEANELHSNILYKHKHGLILLASCGSFSLTLVPVASSGVPRDCPHPSAVACAQLVTTAQVRCALVYTTPYLLCSHLALATLSPPVKRLALTPLCLCLAGSTADPTPCGNQTVYCPTGSVVPQFVQAGFYSDAGTGSVGIVGATANFTIMSRQVECPAGYYCTGGVAYGCPPGTYQGRLRETSLANCTGCPPGYFCGRMHGSRKAYACFRLLLTGGCAL